MYASVHACENTAVCMCDPEWQRPHTHILTHNVTHIDKETDTFIQPYTQKNRYLYTQFITQSHTRNAAAVPQKDESSGAQLHVRDVRDEDAGDGEKDARAVPVDGGGEGNDEARDAPVNMSDVLQTLQRLRYGHGPADSHTPQFISHIDTQV